LRAPAKINNPSNRHLKVLVAPLDWGLGHATRCIPIIKELKNQRFEIIIAASAAQKALLQEEFPSLTFVELPGYRIKYGKNRAFTVLRLILSIPKILICIKQENAWLRRFAARECPDLVISDNRYGLALPGIFCVFVTHQLRIRTPFGPWADRFLQRMNYRAIRGFSRCWVPDEEGEGGLAGELSHPRQMPPIPVRYIGWLSRFDGDSGEAGDRSAGPGLLVLLSGPEPQRSILEGKILAQAGSDVGRMVVVRGLPGGGRPIGDIPSGVTVYDHLPAAELEKMIRSADHVLARPGYSTIMDMARLGRKAIYIPTPGQSEQEYLGRVLAGKGWGVCRAQRGFSLAEALEIGRRESDGAAKTGRCQWSDGEAGEPVNFGGRGKSRVADELREICSLLGV
jgi:UDP:flavonoid glycosyltransferase YjiC (YdhE family)